MEASAFEIERSLNLLFAPGDTVELRCVGNGKTVNGYYRDPHKLARDAVRLNQDFTPRENVYVCLNPTHPQLFARRPDEFGASFKGTATKDADVLCRRWLLIDLDPVRPPGVSATGAQKAAVIRRARDVYQWLAKQFGVAGIVCADSGNGVHMLLRLPDVSNDSASRLMCGRLLQRLSDEFSDSSVKIDQTTFNAARICTLYGTVKRKGGDIPEQPHRMSRLVYVPELIQPLDWKHLTNQIVLPISFPAGESSVTADLDIDRLLHDRQIKFSRQDGYHTSDGNLATKWELEICPWNESHDDHSAWIIQWPNGTVAAGCHHDGCAGNDWNSLRELWNVTESGEITPADIVIPQSKPSLVVTPAHTIAPQPIQWLWPNRIALGKLSIIAGRGATGKTFLTCDLAARISAGREAPDGETLCQGRVLIATGEDGLADTLVPRLIAHEADLTRVNFIEGVSSDNEVELLDLLRHVEQLREALIACPDTVLLLVDPITSFMGAGIDTHKTSDVRRVLSAVAKVAEEHNVAFVGIHHLRKASGPAIHAITGSQAFTDAVRTVWLVGQDQDDPKRRLMLPLKNNLAEAYGSGMAYHIEMGRLIWEPDPVIMDADELMHDLKEPTPREEACSWLMDRLQGGPQPARLLLKEASDDGIAERTLRRAKRSLAVTSERVDGQWSWRLQAKTATNEGQISQ